MSTEEPLQTSTRRTIDLAPLPVFVWQGEVLTGLNRAARGLVGVDDEEAVPALTPAQLIPLAGERHALLTARPDLDGSMSPLRCRLRCVDGAVVEAEVRIGALEGDQVAWWVTARPPSRVQEAERRRSHARAIDAHHLESFSLLTGGIAHDVNNLLVAVVGNAEVALAESTSPVLLRACLSDIAVAARQAGDLSRQLLIHAGRHRTPAELLDISEVVRETADLLHSLLMGRAEVELQLGEGLPALLADRSQLRQVLMNLVGNAADALASLPADARPPIVVRTSAAELTEPLEVSARSAPLPPGRYARLIVEDRGSGLEASQADELFTPWVTSKPNGHGLGLATTGAVVRRHGGGVLVQSDAERTRFSVWLPVAADGRAPLSEPVGTVLFVDASPLVRRFAVRCLGLHHYRVLEARDTAGAIALLEEERDHVDCAIVDVAVTPAPDGEIVTALRRRYPTLPIIGMGGFRDEVTLAYLRAHDVEQFLTKPFTPESLTREVEWAISGGV